MSEVFGLCLLNRNEKASQGHTYTEVMSMRQQNIEKINSTIVAQPETLI